MRLLMGRLTLLSVLLLTLTSAGILSKRFFSSLEIVKLDESNFYDSVLLSSSKTKWLIMFTSPVHVAPGVHSSGARNADNCRMIGRRQSVFLETRSNSES